MTEATFHEQTELEPSAPILIEGFPGTGMVASIAVDRITDQLGLERHGTIRSEAFPNVASFTDGLIQDTVRVHAGADPGVMTLNSDVPIPEEAFSALTDCVIEDLAEECSRAIFLGGAPAQSEEQRGDVIGVATTDSLKEDLDDSGIDVSRESGAVGGVTGSLVDACYRADDPAALLLVHTDPRLPDPRAAHAVIEDALEPLVEFEIDTDELLEQAETIQQQKQQIAQQLQSQSQPEDTAQSRTMFQ